MNKTGLFLFIICLFLLTRCSIKEDRDDCPKDFDYDLLFIYYGDGETDIFPSKIENVNMYIFDEDGNYIHNYTYSKSSLNTFQGAHITLPTGIYTVVCWSNMTEESTISKRYEDDDNLSSYRLYSTPYIEGETITNFDSLYYGRQIIQISPNKERSDTVFFSSAHVKVEVYVEGLESSSPIRAIGDPQGWLEVRNVYTGYNFRKNVTGEVSNMYPDFIYNNTGNIALAKFNLFRFEEGNHILIDIYNGEGEEVYSLNLQEFLLSNGIVVVGKNEVLIPIYIKFQGPYVNVSVAEWNSNQVKPIF